MDCKPQTLVLRQLLKLHSLATRQRIISSSSSSTTMEPDTISLGLAALVIALILLYTHVLDPDCSRSPVNACVEQLRRRGIKCVVFDMDQCLVAAHSRGSMCRQDLHQFIRAVTPSFQSLVPALKMAGIKLAIATHSDGIEHTNKKPRTTHIIGKELADAVLFGSVPQDATAFFVVAFNQKRRAKTQYDPSVHGTAALLDSSSYPSALAAEHNKRLHMHMIAAHFNLSTSDLILFDDDPTNVSQTGGDFMAVKVDDKLGFQLSDIGDMNSHTQ
jgi:hypothetical protein